MCQNYWQWNGLHLIWQWKLLIQNLHRLIFWYWPSITVQNYKTTCFWASACMKFSCWIYVICWIFLQMHRTRIRLLEYGECCMQRARTHTTCTKSNISDLLIFVQRLEFCNCLNANHQVHCYIPHTKQNSITTVSTIRTILTCCQMRLLKPLWKLTFNYISLS